MSAAAGWAAARTASVGTARMPGLFSWLQASHDQCQWRKHLKMSVYGAGGGRELQERGHSTAMADSPRSMAEAYTVLESNYAPIKKILKKNECLDPS